MLKNTLNLLLILLISAASSEAAVYKIKGEVLDHKGNAFKIGHIFQKEEGRDRWNIIHSMDDNKKFEIELDFSGYTGIMFTGLYHDPVEIMLSEDILNKENELSIRLKGPLTGKGPALIEQGPKNNLAHEMDFVNSEYKVVINNPSYPFEYVIRVDEVNETAGQQHDEVKITPRGRYVSVIKSGGEKLEIGYEPFQEELKEPVIDSDNKDLAQYLRIYPSLSKDREDFLKSYQSFARKGKADSLLDMVINRMNRLEKDIDNSENTELNKFRYIEYLNMAGIAFMNGKAEAVDKEFVREAMEKLPPTSILWNEWGLGMGIIVAAEELAANRDYLYLDAIIREYPVKSSREQAAYEALKYNYILGDRSKGKYYYQIMKDEFPGSPLLKEAAQFVAMSENSLVGKQAPDFSIKALDDSETVYSKESMKGRYYLLDFWASWCGPCVKEMDKLHKVYKKFSDKNFEILSVSFDRQKDAINKFRDGKWKMPWLHSFADGGFGSPIAKAYQVTGIPKPLLIGPDGKVLAEGQALRGFFLEQTISKHLK
ncbi:MAG: thioredoxin-like domain-containing protein [Candidatus Kapaibacterium sp.]